MWNGELNECIHQNHVFRARIRHDAIEPRFLSWYANTTGQRYFFVEGKQTTNLASVNMTKLSSLPVPVPPKPEQTRIVAEAERRLTLLDSQETAVEHGLIRVQRLRQSVLKRAFEGHLVPQDLTDEPASVLLERIRAEHGKVQPARRRHKTRAVKPRLTEVAGA